MRLLVRGITAALVILLAVQFAKDRSRRAAVTPFVPVDLHPGDAVPAIQLNKIGNSGAAPVLLTELTGTSCHVLVVFDSKCGACEQDAPRWSDLMKVPVGSDSVPVVWLGLAQDSGAAAFLRDFRLPDAYAAASVHELGKLGIRGTPSVLRVDGSRLVTQLPRLPTEIAEGEYSCSTVRPNLPAD